MTNLISMDKQYKTRDGRDVRVLCVDNNGACAGSYPVVATIEGAVSVFTATGGFYLDSEEDYKDLVEVAQEHVVWVELCTLFGHVNSYVYTTEEEMMRSIKCSEDESWEIPYKLLATKKVVVVEGEFCL